MMIHNFLVDVHIHTRKDAYARTHARTYARRHKHKQLLAYVN